MKITIAILSLAALIPHSYAATAPAPKGDAKVVAELEIRKAEHPCGSVTSARRNPSGSIYAVCANSEDYLIANIKTKEGEQTMVMRCSVLPKINMPRSTCKNTN